MNQAFIVRNIGSSTMDFSVDMTPDEFISIMKEHRKIFALHLRRYDSETGKADFSLVPGNGVVFCDTPSVVPDVEPWKDRVKQWAIDRNLIEGSTPWKQLVKLEEETEELSEALGFGNTKEIIDAIGDIQVVLAVMCAQLGLDIDQCREAAWDEIKDRKGKMVDGVFVKEVQGE